MASGLLGRYASIRLASLALALASPAYAHSQMDTLEDVNWQVNKLPLTDCKAASFEKMRRLERAGITGRFVVVYTETGGAHAIVVVDGEYALDNRQKRVMTVNQLRAAGYQIGPLPH